MGAINFTQFDLLTADKGDFLVGHDSAGSKEIKVQIESILSLTQLPTNFLRKAGDTVSGKLFSVQSNPNQFTIETEFVTKRYVDFMASNRLFWSTPPTASARPGIPGQLAYDQNYLYICVAPNTWKRTILATWE